MSELDDAMELAVGSLPDGYTIVIQLFNGEYVTQLSGPVNACIEANDCTSLAEEIDTLTRSAMLSDKLI